LLVENYSNSRRVRTVSFRAIFSGLRPIVEVIYARGIGVPSARWCFSQYGATFCSAATRQRRHIGKEFVHESVVPRTLTAVCGI
jgi:hypothetical protein